MKPKQILTIVLIAAAGIYFAINAKKQNELSAQPSGPTKEEALQLIKDINSEMILFLVNIFFINMMIMVMR